MPGRQDYTGTEGSLRPRMSYVAPFNPTSLVNGFQGGFWRADMGVSHTGSSVTAWADQSSNANTLGGGSGQVIGPPLWGATLFNTSFPGIGFNTPSGTGGTDRLMTNPNSGAGNIPFTSSTMSMFALAIVTSAPTNTNIADFSNVTSGAWFTNPEIVFSVGSSNNTFAAFSGGYLGNGGSSAGVAFSTSVPVVLGCILDGANAHVYVNFVEQGSGNAFSSTIGQATADNGFAIGDFNNPSWNMVLAWIMLTSHAWSAGDISNMKTWTNSNWGTSF